MQARPKTGQRFDVIVVGAGLAGLNAARHLRRAGRSVLVLEARSEVGGRTRTRILEGNVADFGGEWIGWAHRRARALARELGLAVEPARNVGHPVLWRLPGGESIGRLPPARTWTDLARVFAAAAWTARAIDRTAPWSVTRASELDAVSVADWIDEMGVCGEARYILERLIGSLSSQQLERLSLLHLLWWMRHAGDPLRSLHTTFQWRLEAGAQELARGIARQFGDAVRTDSLVRKIVQNDSVIVEVEGGETYESERAIIAVPVPYVERIALNPPLPEQFRELSNLHIGPGTKVIALLPPGHGARHNTVIGGERLWGAWRRGDRVTGFAPPPAAELPDDELRADLAHAFNVAAGDLRSPSIFRWAGEAHIPGCDVAFAPGELCRYGPLLARPHGRL
ncbi:MAG: flavin monoamine oxidase family protein, partial [Solirubrobacteraceae bacterium]